MNDPSNATHGCEAVNAHISRPIPEKLWHYTTYAAFQGILNSKKIWATEYRFLNDREELNHSKKVTENLLDEEPQYTGDLFPAQDILRKGVDMVFNTGPLHQERLRIMVASFSEEADQLSQWRGYSGNSTGVSIGLDLRGLRPPASIETTVTFAPCVYKESVKRALLQAVFAQYRNSLQEWWDSIVGVAKRKSFQDVSHDPGFDHRVAAEHAKELTDVLQRAQTELRYDLMRIAPLLKNESFSEEREWRLVLPSDNIRSPTNYPIEFRPIRDALVPYIAYPLLMKNQDGPILCTDLILGPGSHPSAETGVNMFFQKQYITTLSRHSNVPYRPS
jgi:hypothetical protein